MRLALILPLMKKLKDFWVSALSHLNLNTPKVCFMYVSKAVCPLQSQSLCFWLPVILVCRVSITKYLCKCDLNSINLFSHSSGGLKSKIKVSVGLISSMAFLLDLQRLPSCCILHAWSFVCAWCLLHVSKFPLPMKSPVRLGESPP